MDIVNCGTVLVCVSEFDNGQVVEILVLKVFCFDVRSIDVMA